MCKKIFIKTEYITLAQFLKFANIISNGGEAKIFLHSNNAVFVNGEPEDRRGRKLYNGYLVKVNGKEYLIQNDLN